MESNLALKRVYKLFHLYLNVSRLQLIWWWWRWWWWWRSGVEGQVVDEISRWSPWKRSTRRRRSTIATRPHHRHTTTTSSRLPHPPIHFRSDQVHTHRLSVRLSWYLATTAARHPGWRTVPSATTCWYPKPEAVSSEVTWPTNMTSLGDGQWWRLVATE